MSHCRAIPLAIALTLHFGAAHATAETIGPLVYHNFTDSPFDLSRVGIDFFLEDFSRGIEQIPRDPAAPAWNDQIAKLSTPGVCETSGRSRVWPDGKLYAFGMFTNFWANEGVTELSFEFSIDELGHLPQAVGFVTGNYSTVTVRFYGPRRELVEMLVAPPAPLPDPIPRLGGLEDTITFYRRDRFFGAIHLAGISRVELMTPTRGATVDDFYYGRLIPESATYLQFSLGWTLLLFRSRVQSKLVENRTR